MLAKEEADSTDLHQKLHSLGALVVNDYLLAEGVVVNNVAKPGSRASWLMRLSGGLIVSQAAIKTGFGPWVKYKGPAKGTRRHVLITPSFRKRHPRFAVLAQTRMQELNWKVYVRALAGCGTLVVLSVSRLPCLERRAPGNRTEDKAATWVNAAKAAKTKKNYVSVGLVQEKSVLTSTKMFNAHTFAQWGALGAIERFCLGHSRQ